MAAAFADAGLKEFGLALDELAEDLEFLRLSSRLRPRLGALLNWQAVDGDAAQLAKGFMNLKTVELSPLYRGMIAVLSGTFEQLVRRVVQEAVLQINNDVDVFDKLPDGIKVHNLFFSGRALCAVREPPDHVTIDHYLLVRSLATCTPGAQKFVLNADAFAMFITNLTPSHLGDICHSIGVSLNWDYFGKVNAFEKLFGSKGARSLGKMVSDRLADIVKLRNRIAHTGAGGVTVSEEDVASHIAFLRILGLSFSAFIEAEL